MCEVGLIQLMVELANNILIHSERFLIYFHRPTLCASPLKGDEEPANINPFTPAPPPMRLRLTQVAYHYFVIICPFNHAKVEQLCDVEIRIRNPSQGQGVIPVRFVRLSIRGRGLCSREAAQNQEGQGF